MNGQDLGRLAAMARMVQDAGTARLRQAAEAREAVRAQIAALDATRPTCAPQDTGEAKVAFAYEQWASRRRATLNIELAKREAVCLGLLEAARHDFGRARVIDRLIEKGGRAKPPR